MRPSIKSAIYAVLIAAFGIGAARAGTVGGYPNATSPLNGTERMLSDQSSSGYPCTACTVDITPLQLANFTAAQAASYSLMFNNNGAIGALIPSATGQYCLDWASLTAGPTLVSCTGGGSLAFSAITSGTNAEISAPTQGTPTTATTGGSLPASTTYYFVITATNANGQTTISSVQSIATGSGTATNTVTPTWTAVTGATGYTVWMSTSTITAGEASVAYSTASSSATSLTIGTVPATTATTPSANTTGAAMLVGTGSSLAATGSGSIAATTAAALAANPTTCSSTQAATGILANGNATGCFTPSGSGTVTDGSGTTTANELLLSSTTAHAYTNATTLPTSALPALAGDVTSSAGSNSVTVSKVSGVAGTATTFTTYNATSGSITVSPPTGALGTLNLTWPSVSGIIPAITGTITTGDCAKFASATSITDAGACGSGGSGTINAAAQYATPYYSSAGSSTTLSGLASPTTGPGYYEFRYDPTSTTAVAPTIDQEGAGTRSINGATTTDTVAYSDLFAIVLHDKAATGTVTETLPTPTTLSNAHFGYTYCNNSAQTDTIMPTTWTISKDNGAASSSISVPSGQCEQIVPDPFNSSQWDAFSSNSGGGSSGITLENGGTSVGTITTLNCSTGTTCSAASGVGTLTASGGSNAAFYTYNGPMMGVSGTGYSVPIANDEYIYSWNLPVTLSISYIIVNIQTVDATNSYSFAIYNSSGTLKCSTTAQSFSSTGFVKLACSQGSNIALAPGQYAFGYTGSATTLKLNTSPVALVQRFALQNAGTTTGGNSLASITFPGESLNNSTIASTPWFAVE